MDGARQLRDHGPDNVVPMRERAGRPPDDATAAAPDRPERPSGSPPSPAHDPGPDRQPDGLLDGVLATLGHFSQWLLLVGVVGTLLVGGRWIASRAELPANTPREISGTAVSSAATTPPGAVEGNTANRGDGRPAGSVDGKVPADENGDGEDALPGTSAAGSTATAAGDPVAAGEVPPGASRTIGTAAETVLLVSTPPGARVLIDGLALPDETPTRVPLQEGARIRLEAAGFEPLETTFQAVVGARPPQLDYQLTPLPSTLRRVRAPAEVPYPRKTRQVEPTVPASAAGPADGIVILALEIDAEGDVIDVSVLRGVAPALDRAALDAAWRWKFEPTEVDGRPVHVLANFTVSVGRS